MRTIVMLGLLLLAGCATSGGGRKTLCASLNRAELAADYQRCLASRH